MNRTRLYLASAFGLFVVLLVLENLRADEPFDWVNFAIDSLETALLACAVALTAFGAIETRELRRERRDLLSDLDRARTEGARWRSTARSHVDGLSRAITEQFRRWNLTEAEADVALLMLKGLTHKEIATLRDCAVATVRQHAAVVYRKSQLTNRAQLTGYFLEDLLAPTAEGDRPTLSIVDVG